MAPSGQLQEETSNYTPIELLVPDWIKQWNVPVASTGIVDVQAVQAFLVYSSFSLERSFSRRQVTQILRLTYASVADQIADPVSHRHEWFSTPIDLVPAAVSEATGADVAPPVLIDKLVAWLGITFDELARMTGISRSALFYLKKTGASPRPGNERQLLRVFSVASILVRRFGQEGARRWLHSDGSDAWELLKDGELAEAEELVRSRLFGTRSYPARSGRSLPDETTFSGGVGSDVSIKRASRRPKRG